MKIIGCDFHPSYQQIAMLDTVTGEMVEKALSHDTSWCACARRWKLWSEVGRRQLESLPLLPWASRRRVELLQLFDHLEASIKELDCEVAEQAYQRREARRLMTHPRVGPVTALAFTLTMGPAKRFGCGRQVASYLGLIPSEHSSGGRQQRLGHISKQGSPFLRGLLVEAAQSAVRYEPEMRRAYPASL
jgi:transposase